MKTVARSFLGRLCLCSLMLGGCASDISVPPVDGPAPVAATAGTHLLTSGDLIRVSVLGENYLDGIYQVASDGRVVLPLIGAVAVDGVTLDALDAFVTRRLRRYEIRHGLVELELVPGLVPENGDGIAEAGQATGPDEKE